MQPKIFIESRSWDESIPFKKKFEIAAEYPYGVNVEIYYAGGNVETRYNCNQVHYGYKRDTKRGYYQFGSTGCTTCKTVSSTRFSSGSISTDKITMIRIVKATKKH